MLFTLFCVCVFPQVIAINVRLQNEKKVGKQEKKKHLDKTSETEYNFVVIISNFHNDYKSRFWINMNNNKISYKNCSLVSASIRFDFVCVDVLWCLWIMADLILCSSQQYVWSNWMCNMGSQYSYTKAQQMKRSDCMMTNRCSDEPTIIDRSIGIREKYNSLSTVWCLLHDSEKKTDAYI